MLANSSLHSVCLLGCLQTFAISSLHSVCLLRFMQMFASSSLHTVCLLRFLQNVCQFNIIYCLSSAILRMLPFIITYCLSSAIFANVCQFIIAKCRAVFLTQLSAEICKAISSTENSYIYLSVLGWRQWGWMSGHPVYQHRLTLRTTSVKVNNCPLLNSMAGRLAIQEHKWLKQG